MRALARAAGLVAWGYVFYYIDLNLNFNGMEFSVVPDWAAYIFFLAALPEISAYRRGAALLRPLGVALLIYELFVWVLDGLGVELAAGYTYIPVVVFSVLTLYFNFQLLTELARIADDADERLGKSLRYLRSVSALWTTVMSLFFLLPERMLAVDSGSAWQAASAFVLIAFLLWGCVCCIMTFVQLFRLRRLINAAI